MSIVELWSWLSFFHRKKKADSDAARPVPSHGSTVADSGSWVWDVFRQACLHDLWLNQAEIREVNKGCFLNAPISQTDLSSIGTHVLKDKLFTHLLGQMSDTAVTYVTWNLCCNQELWQAPKTPSCLLWSQETSVSADAVRTSPAWFQEKSFTVTTFNQVKFIWIALLTIQIVFKAA